ncbi:carboxypeptidase N subunit 2-like isoform X2 [Macrobrachium rosenbergii]|uniref:carboxypeptidase N subunit 2-like isoform X2 n=1 Tax=Macrobrachium rosenbergii TaxID=79674 RepID=UPI0034D4E334
MTPRSSLKTSPKHTDCSQGSQGDACRRRPHLGTRGTTSRRPSGHSKPSTAILKDPSRATATTTTAGDLALGSKDRDALGEENHYSRGSVEGSLESATTMPCLVYNTSEGTPPPPPAAAATSSASPPPVRSPMRSPNRRHRGAAAANGISFVMPKIVLPKLLLPAVCFCFLILIGSMVTPCGAICPDTCTCDDVSLVVRCEPSPNIDVLPLTFNPGLQQLTMYGTEIHTLDINSMMWYVDLRHVNLSKNMIMRVMPRTFEKQGHLEELHLAQNNISELESEMFYGLSKLIVLSLRGNVIESLDGRVFVYLKQLKDLDLSENRLEVIKDDALTGLSNLRVLHLHDNRLAAIPSQNLALVPDLAYLSLGGNEFLEVNEFDLASQKTLKDLNLSGAQLGDGLTADSFRGLSGLTKLMLEDCGLKEVPTAALSPLTKLEELHIGRNLFTSLPPNAFSDNRHLSALHVSGCPDLTYINKDVLHNNVNIKSVVITQNPHLTYIDEDAFRFLSELSLLDLHGNNIQTLSENAASWKDIEKWSLEGNPIACNCSAAWLRTLILAPNSSSSVKCVSPPSLSGVPLASTQMIDLACGMDPAIKGLVIGLVVTVVVVVAIVVVLLYRHHGSCVHRLLKGHRLDRHGGTFGHHSCSHDHYQGYIMTPQKPVPVTEL